MESAPRSLPDPAAISDRLRRGRALQRVNRRCERESLRRGALDPDGLCGDRRPGGSVDDAAQIGELADRRAFAGRTHEAACRVPPSSHPAGRNGMLASDSGVLSITHSMARDVIRT
jgi:hypothetical protein